MMYITGMTHDQSLLRPNRECSPSPIDNKSATSRNCSAFDYWV